MYKKFLWIPISLVIGLVVWYVLKINIYDIKVPETPAVKTLWDAGEVNDWNRDTVDLKAGSEDFLKIRYDSITWPQGISLYQPGAMSTAPLDETYELVWSRKALPLQLVKVWINGFAYAKVLRRINSMDSLANADFDSYVTVYQPNDKSRKPGLYKENFDENKIVLTLEKPNPIKIIALWENYIIKGETDGKSIKITVPRAATKVQESVVRVWVCDEKDVSSTCTIPLHFGIIPTKLKAEEKGNVRNGINQFVKSLNNYSGFWDDSTFQGMIHSKLNKILADESMVPVVAYGDIRVLQVNNNVMAIMGNYFGKKIVLVFNNHDKPMAIKFPFKGELKKCYEGLNFNQKGATLQVTIPGNSHAVFY